MMMKAKFAGTCKTCGGQFPAGAMIDWEAGRGVSHFTAAECIPGFRVEEPKGLTLDLSGIVAFLGAAKERGLKFPKARFLAVDGRTEMRLSLAGWQSRVPGSLQVVVGETWQGRIEPSGKVVGFLATDQALQALLVRIAESPVEHAQAYGALMCRCSFCNLALTDEGSVEVGYGPICAEHWGLPHTPKGTRTLTAVE